MALFLSIATEASTKRALLSYYAAFLFLGIAFAAGQTNVSNISALPDAAEVEHEIAQIQALMPVLSDRGAAFFFLAHDYAHLGEIEKALTMLKQCLSLDEGFDPEGDPIFASLRENPEYMKLVKRVNSRFLPVHQAHEAYTVLEKDLIPEGLAADSGRSVLYMSSLNLNKIVKVEKDGRVWDFVIPGRYNVGPICGMKVELSDHSVWADVCPDSGLGAELLHFDPTGTLTERFSPPTSGQHLFNDLVLRGKDEVYVTDSLANCVYRLDRRSHRFNSITLSRESYYPNGIALSDDGNMLYVADAFGVLAVDLVRNRTWEVDPGLANTLSGIDGLYSYRNDLVAVQNGLGSSRVARFVLSHDGRRIDATTVLEYKSSLVTVPTTGAIDGRAFYFISNTGADNFKDNKIVDPYKLESIRISVVELHD